MNEMLKLCQTFDELGVDYNTGAYSEPKEEVYPVIEKGISKRQEKIRYKKFVNIGGAYFMFDADSRYIGHEYDLRDDPYLSPRKGDENV